MHPKSNIKMNPRQILFIVVVLLVSACSQSVDNNIEAAGISSPTPEATVDYMESLILTSIRSSFSTSPHAAGGTCNQCHPTNSDAMKKELVWFNKLTQQFESISTSTALCGKCHTDQNHIALVGVSTVLAHPDFECASCHDPHSTQANCTQSTCHNNIQKIRSAIVERPEFHSTTGDPNSYMCGGTACHDLAKQVITEPIYHQPVHREIPCYVCHDVSGLPVSSSDNGNWFTVRDSLSDSNSFSAEVVSHQIGRDVNCTKCHYGNNPWKLVEQLSSN